MKTTDRRALLNILEDRHDSRLVRAESGGDPERALANLATTLATKTAAYRKDLAMMLDTADDLQGKLPGMVDSLEHMTGALEMSDKMLEDLTDAVLSDTKPIFKKLGLPVPKGY